MHILYMTQLYAPMLFGGGEYVFSKWAEELASRGHVITVITQRFKGTKDAELLNGVKVYRVSPQIEYGGSLYGISPADSLKFLRNATRLALTLLKGHDLIHSNPFASTLAAEIAARLTGKPHVATIHDVYLQPGQSLWKKWSISSDISSLSQKIAQTVERIILKLMPTCFLTCSATSRNDLIKNGVRKASISVIPYGINLSEYGLNAQKKPFQICYIGRLVHYKNIDTVIRAVKKAAEVLPQIKFIVAGKGPYEKQLKVLTASCGLEKKVIFAGRIPADAKVRLLSESQLMVQPSLVEGFGITVIESFACATPVLSSNVMPLPELVQDGINGMTIAPFDDKTWALNLCNYLSDPKKCKKQGEQGKKLVVEKYTNSKVVDQLTDLYRSILLGTG